MELVDPVSVSCGDGILSDLAFQCWADIHLQQYNSCKGHTITSRQLFTEQLVHFIPPSISICICNKPGFPQAPCCCVAAGPVAVYWFIALFLLPRTFKSFAVEYIETHPEMEETAHHEEQQQQHQQQE